MKGEDHRHEGRQSRTLPDWMSLTMTCSCTTCSRNTRTSSTRLMRAKRPLKNAGVVYMSRWSQVVSTGPGYPIDTKAVCNTMAHGLWHGNNNHLHVHHSVLTIQMMVACLVPFYCVVCFQSPQWNSPTAPLCGPICFSFVYFLSFFMAITSELVHVLEILLRQSNRLCW